MTGQDIHPRAEMTTADAAARAQATAESSAIQAAIESLVASHRAPSATYRVQFNAGFTFDHAHAIADYLHDLGISHIYASPIFQARQGSTHGYDVCDPTIVSATLGGEAGLDALSAALAERHMGLVLDIVPNHMGINDPCNTWWLNVLESGPSSEYASFFDIEWNPVKPELRNRVLLPILEDQYGNVLEAGKLRLLFEDGAFWITYYKNRLPIAPRTYLPILNRILARLTPAGPGRDTETLTALTASTHAPDTSADADPRIELASIITAVGHLPEPTETDPEKRAERAREKEVIKRRLVALCQSSREMAALFDAVVAELNGRPDDPASFNELDALLEAQIYRLAHWRVAGEEINYRRFFDINDLAALRVELPRVFQATHALAFRLLAEGKVSGFRVDHPDGLYDPVAYFARLQERHLRSALQREMGLDDTPELAEEVGRWVRERAAAQQRQGCRWPLFVVAEKILSEREPLPLDWAVCGTTGYDFLASANGLFIHPAHANRFTAIYEQYLGEGVDFERIALDAQKLIMKGALASEINELSHEIERIGERNRHYRDFTLYNLRVAVREVMASLPVYRTYINAETGAVSERDRKVLTAAIRQAARRRSDIDASVFRFVEDTLLLRNLKTFGEQDRVSVRNWVMKFQQISGPVMAKGVEDTTFYRYHRLVSLNEVGGHPVQFGTTVEQFHRDNARRATHWPHSMLTTSTHDNKRSEDVRTRVDVLSELPDVWAAALAEWSELNAGARTALADGMHAPDRNDEYLFYQTLLGTWPFASPPTEGDSPWGFLWQPAAGPQHEEYAARITTYMQKAVKEAKIHGSWISPDEAYDEGLAAFVSRLLSPEPENRFLASLAPLARRVAYFGQFNALAQTVLKLTSPGLPDIYQGNELWDLSLVDPDNRRPVDYARRQQALAAIRDREAAMPAPNAVNGNGRLALAHELLDASHDGCIKLYVTYRTLNYRRSHDAFFADAAYQPLTATGTHAGHVVAFARTAGEGHVIVVVPRLVATLMGERETPPIGGEVWQDTRLTLPAEWTGMAYRNLFTGEHLAAPALPLGQVLGHFPVAVLVPEV